MASRSSSNVLMTMVRAIGEMLYFVELHFQITYLSALSWKLFSREVMS
ncbi:MAG: hypothetical protein ACNI26_08540 [Terasakiella sp.]|nr:hypothetical protein [Terasakiella brassicae]